MYEANTAVVGNVITHPVRRSLPGGDQVLSFRMASNARRLDHSSGTWVDNGTLFLTVHCRRRLVEGVDTSLRLGDPIIVYGQLRSAEYRTRDGVRRHDLELRASALGPDLARCTAPVSRRFSRNSTDPASVDPEAAVENPLPRSAGSDPVDPFAATAVRAP
jgi:single-strand DNA-binding protein